MVRTRGESENFRNSGIKVKELRTEHRVICLNNHAYLAESFVNSLDLKSADSHHTLSLECALQESKLVEEVRYPVIHYLTNHDHDSGEEVGESWVVMFE